MGDANSTPYVIVPQGMHLLELLKYNSRNIVGVIDHRANGVLRNLGADKIFNELHEIGQEQPWPLVSIWQNKQYYKNVAMVLNQFLDKYPDCQFIVTSNYIPFTRFIIDFVGADRVELWEDGLNHYLKLESLSIKYYLKEAVKLSAGFYSKGTFDNDYRVSELTVYDRFNHQNLDYPISKLFDGEDYYIGQPLIEDQLISESKYKSKLETLFKGQKLNYLPHPREKNRKWISEIFNVLEISMPAEEYLKQQGATSVYSAFSTVNVNIQCQKNLFLANYLGLGKIADRLKELKFQVELV